MEILKTLDNMPRLLFWRVDDVLVMFVPFSLGILFGSLTLLFGGFFAKLIYARLRKGYMHTNLRGLLYWSVGTSFKRLPPSYVRIFRR